MVRVRVAVGVYSIKVVPCPLVGGRVVHEDKSVFHWPLDVASVHLALFDPEHVEDAPLLECETGGRGGSRLVVFLRPRARRKVRVS